MDYQQFEFLMGLAGILAACLIWFGINSSLCFAALIFYFLYARFAYCQTPQPLSGPFPPTSLDIDLGPVYVFVLGLVTSLASIWGCKKVIELFRKS